MSLFLTRQSFETHGIRPQFLCVLVIIVGRFVNAGVPLLFADLVFVFEQGITSPPWLFLFGYVGLRFLQSSGGLPALRDVGHTRRLCYHRVVFI
jgi:hypothetical protein